MELLQRKKEWVSEPQGHNIVKRRETLDRPGTKCKSHQTEANGVRKTKRVKCLEVRMKIKNT